MAASEIERYHGQAAGRTRATAWGDLVFSVATAPDPGADIAQQTRRALAAIDQNLAEAGSDRTRLLSATVYLTDTGNKPGMDEVWNDWVGPREHWPQRACVQAGLAADTLVEVTVIATRA